jgi:catalase (peroxidase I)
VLTRLAHETALGYSGPWTFTPTTFNNAYYTILTSLKWTPTYWSGPPQYVDGVTGKLMMLPTKLILLDDKSFLKWVNVYAKDGQNFNKEFVITFQKLEPKACGRHNGPIPSLQIPGRKGSEEVQVFPQLCSNIAPSSRADAV